MIKEKTLQEILIDDPLAKFDQKIDLKEFLNKFSGIFNENIPKELIGILRPFYSDNFRSFWSPELLLRTLKILNTDLDRSIRAISVRHQAIDRGLDNLFFSASILSNENSCEIEKPKDLILLATGFMPEYLRWAEHIFGNLIETYWSILKKGSVDGKFDIKGACSRIKSQEKEFLLDGYVEEVRNSIAHGDFKFTGFNIEFGIKNPKVLTSSEFLNNFDCLCRTSNTLAIGLIIFWYLNKESFLQDKNPPLSLIKIASTGSINRTGLNVMGAVESETELGGRQLHISTKMEALSKNLVVLNASRVAAQFMLAGAEAYDRFLIGVDHGMPINSLVIVFPKKLKAIFDSKGSIARLPEILDSTQILWFDESQFKARIKAWRIILKRGFFNFKFNLLDSFQEQQFWLGKGRYSIKEIEVKSTQGKSRLHVRAILKNRLDVEDRELINKIIHEIVASQKWKRIDSRDLALDPGINWKKRPEIIYVDLFRENGPLRWLKSGGWHGGNLIAVAEYNRKNQAKYFIETPQEIYKGIRIRYEINQQEANETLHRYATLMREIYETKYRSEK